MEKFLLQKITAQKIKNILNSFLFFFVVLSVVFYPLVFSMSYSIAAGEESSSESSEVSATDPDKEDGESEEEEESEDKKLEEEDTKEDEGTVSDESEEKKEEVNESEKEESAAGEEYSNGEQGAEDTDTEDPALFGSTQDNGALETGEMIAGETLESDESNDTDDFWKTCDLSDEEEDQIESDECEECREKTDCEEIEICIVEKIENNNETEIENDVSSEADSGNNSVADTGVIENPTSSDETEGSEDYSEETAEDNLVKSDVKETDGDETAGAENQEQIAASEPVINTGEAVASANVYNEANINIVSENYVSEILNIDGKYVGDINLLEKFQELLNRASANGEESGTLIEVSNTNEATLENILFASANTGNNSIEASEGGLEGAEIKTGNASAVSNLVNYVNINITGNNWLFYAVNIFGKWLGDLIVPGEGLLKVPETSETVLSEVTNENSAAIENTAESSSNSGNNEITGGGNISTGETVAVANVKNIVNTNITSNNWFFLMINNMGAWKGSVFGWNEGNAISNIFRYDFDILDSDGGVSNFLGSIFSVYNKNTAKVSNSVSASADTGNNSIKGMDGDISTGDAYSWSNIFNFINTNITGNNWMFSVVNVMGEWEGDTVFAYPDLKISISDEKDRAVPGEELDYTVEYENVGQAGCEDAKVYVGLPEYFSYESNDVGKDHSSEDGMIVWDLDGLQPGEKKSFTIKGKLSERFPEGKTTLEAGAGITTSTKEIESGNNSSSDKTEVSNYADIIYFEYPEIDPEIKITRGVSPGNFVRQGNLVLYSIMLENEGDTPVYNLVVEDRIKNEAGDLGGYEWSVGEIGKGERIVIQYQVIISMNAPLGIYTNQAVAYGNDAYGDDYESKEAASQIEVIMGLAFNIYNENIAVPVAEAKGENRGQILGDETWKNDSWERNLWLGFLLLLSLLLLYELYIFRKNKKEKEITMSPS